MTVAEIARKLSGNIQQVMVGKQREVEYVLVALLCGGHVLIEDVPGVGKTTLVRSLARSLGCSFKRIQFTPDLLPTDVTGVSVYNPQRGEFEFRPGPVFSQVVLADEINRTSPKTQAALLECLEEAQVTVDGVTHTLPRPFLVLATQNPIEYEGTFPLPEAQLDRFLLRLRLGYPTAAEEIQVLARTQQTAPEDLQPVASADDVLQAQAAVRQIHVEPALQEYIVEIVQETRRHPDIYLGASPRGSIALYRTSQALAAVRGRGFVLPDDIKEMAPLTLGHRLLLQPEARFRDVTAEEALASILQRVPVPVE